MKIGDRMKLYESLSLTQAMPKLPLIVRFDGKGFSKYTSNLSRPYCPILQDAMDQVTKDLCEYTNAVVGYTQSDEITLILHTEKPESSIFFDGKIHKIVSVLASYCTLQFSKYHNNQNKLALFDCRAFTVPSKVEACNVLLWREYDATRNSIQMAARAFFSHNQCHCKNGKQLQELLMTKNINWNDYPARFKRGQYFKRVEKEYEIPQEYSLKAGEKYIRKEYNKVYFPVLTKLANPVETIFAESFKTENFLTST